MTLYQRITQARSALTAAGIATRDAGFDADLLATHALGCDRAQLVTRLRDEEPPGFAARYAPLVARRVIGRGEVWVVEAFAASPSQ